MNPTDDLSARHLKVLRDFASAYDADSENGQALRAAIAALSALPAGGEVGVVRWAANIPNTIIEVLWRDGIAPPVGTKLYTTQALPGGEPVAWQARFKRSDGRWSDWAHAPSEGEAKEFVREHSAGGGVAECRALYTTPPPDAAVGGCTCPTGDGSLRWPCPVHSAASAEDGDMMHRHLLDMLGARDHAHAGQIIGQLHAATLAAPAAGKGVDDLLDLATLYGDHSVDSRNRESWDFDAHGLKQLAAALTRQPVAGDGWRPIESAPQVESMLSDIPRCLVYSKDFGIQMGRAWRYADGEARGQGNGFNGEWNVTHFHPLPAAPAATPTDGGEGYE